MDGIHASVFQSSKMEKQNWLFFSMNCGYPLNNNRGQKRIIIKLTDSFEKKPPIFGR